MKPSIACLPRFLFTSPAFERKANSSSRSHSSETKGKWLRCCITAVARNLITASAVFALCAAQSTALAREMPIPGAPGGMDKSKKRNFASCVREVDRSVQGMGTVNNQYMTRFIKVKNFCGRSYNVTLDVAYQRDPKCRKLGPGKTAEFVYSVEMVYTPPPHEYRRIKEC